MLHTLVHPKTVKNLKKKFDTVAHTLTGQKFANSSFSLYISLKTRIIFKRVFVFIFFRFEEIFIDLK